MEEVVPEPLSRLLGTLWLLWPGPEWPRSGGSLSMPTPAALLDGGDEFKWEPLFLGRNVAALGLQCQGRVAASW